MPFSSRDTRTRAKGHATQSIRAAERRSTREEAAKMAKEDFNEGARAWLDPCPECGKPCHFSSDVKAMGKRRIRVCLACGVFVNGEHQGDVTQGPVA